MSLVLIASGAALGVAASPHCLSMCGAPCAALTGGCRGDAARFHAGRLVGYMTAGAIAAAGVGALAAMQQTAPFVRPLWILVQIGFLALGIAWLATGRPIRRLAYATPFAKRLPHGVHVVTMPRSRRALLAGLGWVAWPCGALQGALLLAGMASTAIDGALVMAAYALGSLPALALMTGAARAGARGPAWLQRIIDPATGLRIAGMCLVATSGFALLHGMWMRIAAICAS